MRRARLLMTALVLAWTSSTRAQPVLDGGVVDANIAAAVDAGVASDASVDSGADASEPEEPELPPEHRPSVSVRLEPAATIPTGSLVRVHLTVTAAPGDDVTVPSQSFAPLELHSRRVTERTVRGRTESHFVLELLALAPGDVTLEPISLRVLTADGLVGSVATERISLRVTSVIANEPNAQPRGPTRPRELMEENLIPLYMMGVVALMLLGAVLALMLRRWLARRPKPVPPPPPPRPAWEIAFEKLEALRRDGPAMIAEGRVGPWIDSLNDTVREYLGLRYGFDGLECTSDEVIARVAAIRIQSSTSAELGVFLGECDLVKFAAASMTEEQAETMFRAAQRIVRSTVPGGAGFGQVGGAP